jgi:hypothetical protein
MEEGRVRVAFLLDHGIGPCLEEQGHVRGIGVADVQRAAALVVHGVDLHVLLCVLLLLVCVSV